MPPLLQWLLAIMDVILFLFSLPSLVKTIRQSPIHWMMRDTVAYMQLKTRGWPRLSILIERLDDGSDPLHQKLHFDVAPDFPQGRIEGALAHWTGLPLTRSSIEMALTEFWRQAFIRATRGAESGEERTFTVVMDVLQSVACQTVTLQGRVGVSDSWQTVDGPHTVRHLSKLWPHAREAGDRARQRRAEAKVLRKAKR